MLLDGILIIQKIILLIGFVRNDDYVYALTFVNFTTTIKSIKIYKFPNLVTEGINQIQSATENEGSNIFEGSEIFYLAPDEEIYGLYYNLQSNIGLTKETKHKTVLSYKINNFIYFYFLSSNYSGLNIRIMKYSIENNSFNSYDTIAVPITNINTLKILQFEIINDKTGRYYLILSHYTNDGTSTQNAYANRKFLIYLLNNNDGKLIKRAENNTDFTDILFVDVWDSTLLIMNNTNDNGLKFKSIALPSSTSTVSLQINDDSQTEDFPREKFDDIENLYRTLQTINRYGKSSNEINDTTSKYRFDFITMSSEIESQNLGFDLNNQTRDYSIVSYGPYVTSSTTTSGTDETSTLSSSILNVDTIISHFYEAFKPFQGTSNNSVAVIGKEPNISYLNDNDDIGTNYYLYLEAYRNSNDTTNAFVKTNVIPNYIPV